MQWDSRREAMELDVSDAVFEKIWEPELMLFQRAALQEQLKIYRPILQAHRRYRSRGQHAGNPIVIA